MLLLALGFVLEEVGKAPELTLGEPNRQAALAWRSMVRCCCSASTRADSIGWAIARPAGPVATVIAVESESMVMVWS